MSCELMWAIHIPTVLFCFVMCGFANAYETRPYRPPGFKDFYGEPWVLFCILPIVGQALALVYMYGLFKLIKHNERILKPYIESIVYFLPVLMLGLLWLI